MGLHPRTQEHAPHGGAPTASQRLGDEASEVSLGLSSDASDDQAAGEGVRRCSCLLERVRGWSNF